MRSVERIREGRPANLTLQYLTERESAGWRVSAIEWERNLEGPLGEREPWTEDVPYGLKISSDCRRLEENPDETAVMMTFMELIVQDKRLSEAAAELNRRGLKTREGKAWGPGALFDLLPRLIEAGPKIFRSDEWSTRRKALVKAY